ncbi:MAG: hypothetical protein H0T47_17155 [Planctomycetaceae bacterium]|nr:hypothetical protein [Planctomycetaceae bacterium]
MAANNELEDFCETAIGPACVDFASRIGADEPSRLTGGTRVGYEVRLPSAYKDAGERSVIVCAEPFDDEAFTVKSSRPDTPDQLRQIALVRYESLKDSSKAAEETMRIRASIGESLEALRESLSNRTS